MDWRHLIPDIVCPACKSPLRLIAVSAAPPEEQLRCAACRRQYPVRDNIPILLVEQAHIPE